MSKIFIFFLLIIFLFLPRICSSQWQAMGPQGGQISAFTQNGSNLFAGAYGSGVYISSNNGNSWISASAGYPDPYYEIYAMTSLGSNIFAGNANSIYGGVCISTNNGQSWSSVNNGLSNLTVWALCISGGNLFAGTQGGVFKSTNNGQLWTIDTAGISSRNVVDFTTYGSFLFAGTYPGGVYLSTDNGQTWTAFNSGLTNTNVSKLTSYTNGSGYNIICGTRGGGAFLSTNNGSSWAVINSGLGDFNITALTPASNGSGGYNIFAGTQSHGIYLSTNASSWVIVNSGLFDNYILSFLVSGTNIFAGGNTNGVFLTTNNGSSWTLSSNGINAVDIVALLVSSSRIFTGLFGGGGVFMSTNHGTNWIFDNLQYAAVSDFAYHENELYASTYNGGSGMYKSTDFGTTWNSIATGLSSYEAIIGVADNGFLYTGGLSNVYRSTNDGASWQVDSAGINCTSTYSFGNCGSRILVGTQYCSNGGGIYLSTNYGNNWINTGFGASLVDAILPVPSGNGRLNIYALSGSIFGGQVYLSVDSGYTWQPTSGGPSSALCLANYGSVVFAGTNGQGVYYTTNSGNSWIVNNTGLNNLRIKTIGADSNYVYAGTIYSSLWRRPLPELLGIGNISQEVPQGYFLYQNYPNPFNPSTKIKFNIPVSPANSGINTGGVINVTLKIYDILGREIASLFPPPRGGQEGLSPGLHEVEFNGSNYTSGVYFYKLTVGNFTDTKKMVILK